MIDINLIPFEQRKKKKGQIIPGGFNIPLEVVIGSGGGLLILLVFVHIVLLFTNMSRIAKHKDLKKQWEVILPSKENVDGVIAEMRSLQGRYKAIEELTQKNELVWSQKLNVLSNSLPKGVWLTKIALGEDVLFIDGSAVSKQKESMINVHTFMSNLKKEKNFLTHLTDLELGSIQRRKIKTVDIADFLITTRLEEK